jgi:hypothetical protein
LDLSEYIQQPEEVRRAHLDTAAPCGTGKLDRDRLLRELGVRNDVANWLKAGVTTATVCSGCSNPLHNYVATPGERRRFNRGNLEQRLEPYLTSNLSNSEVARRVGTSATTVARHRRQAGITLVSVVGGDGKEYAVGTDEEKTMTAITRYLRAAIELMTPERTTTEIKELADAIRASCD